MKPLYAKTHRHQVHPHHRRRSHRDRAGVRVRLFRHPGLQGPESRGLPHRPGQLQSGHDHDRSGAGGCDLCRADHARDRRQDHRRGTHGAAGRQARAAADDGRTDRTQYCACAREAGHPEGIRRRDDRRPRRGHPQGRGPAAVPRRDDEDRPGDAALDDGAQHGRGAGRPRPRQAAGDHPAVVHDGRHRRRHRLQQGRVHRDHRARARCLADDAGAGRGERARLEGVRDGGGPRPRGQLHHHLLDRERRPDGRAYR